VTSSRGSRAPKPTSHVNDLSGRCTAEVCFPTTPYQHIRCLGLPGHKGQHNAATAVPTGHADMAVMTTVDLIWWAAS